jgi:septum formation protein
MLNLVLASASPRRRELLTQAGFVFEVRPAHIPEEPQVGEGPIAYVVRLAREKAEAVYREAGVRGQGSGVRERAAADPSTALRSAPDDSLSGVGQGTGPRLGAQDDGLVVVGADTTVVVDGMILGKPEDAADAARMLRMLSGRSHRVITGVAVVRSPVPELGPGAPIRVEVAAEVTAVKFLALSDQDIADYIATGEPMDKAGAYAIQGRAAKWIPRIEGDYFNVVGLPLALVTAMLEGGS